MNRPSHADPALVVALLIVGAVFARGLAGDFVYDDLVLVHRNPALHDPLDLGALLFGPLYGAEQGYWRPLTSVLLAGGNALGAAPALHGTALLLHLLVVVQVAGLGRDVGLTRRAATWGAAVFGVCPIVVEPVAWIASINDLLCGLAGILALRAHLRWRRGGGVGVPVPAAGWLALALLAKENALSVGLLFVAVDVVFVAPPRPTRAAVARAYGSYAVIALAWFGARAAVLGATAAGASAATPLAEPVLRRVEVAGRLLQALLWPADPTPFSAPDPELGTGAVLAGAVSVALLTGLAVVAQRARWRVVTLAVAVFGAVITPAIARLDALGPYPIADRYLYLAAAAAAIAFAWAADRTTPRRSQLLLGLTVVIFGAVSVMRVGIWRDQQSLVQAGIEHHPDDPRLHYMLGQLRLEEFAATGGAATLDAASDQFRIASRLAATQPWNGAAAAVPMRADIAVGLAWCALAYAGQDRHPDWRPVVTGFERLVNAHPMLAPARIGLGVALASAGRLRDAQAEFERAVEIDPRSFEARINLARALTMIGAFDRAVAQLDEALRLRPGDPAATALRAAARSR